VNVVMLEHGLLESAIREGSCCEAIDADRVIGSEDTDGVDLAGRTLRSGSGSCHGASGRGQDGKNGGKRRHAYACWVM